MSDHISKSLIEQFRDRSLDVTILSDISAHLESCDKCYELFREAFRVKRENAPLCFSLSSSRWLKDEHFDYEQGIHSVSSFYLDANNLLPSSVWQGNMYVSAVSL
jgi:hypothetical protein